MLIIGGRVGRPRHWCGSDQEEWLCRDIVATEEPWRQKHARRIHRPKEA